MKYMFQLAFGCAKHPKAGQNTQQKMMILTSEQLVLHPFAGKIHSTKQSFKKFLFTHLPVKKQI